MWDEALLSRVEDAGINASAPAQQRWLDGWILRYAPVKAKRSRGINAVAAGRLGLFDVHTLAAARGQGLATQLCRRLLSLAASQGGEIT
ncbi:MAG: hypothetical protein KGI35_17645 [Burkholderiales bacterium]|nr:hypothetical protein [Burkholderiales bacterium]MDE2397547.1 hypothetical protein [Burkholderiales bacterium]